MPASKRFLHPEAIARISRLELRARHIVEGFLSGIHRSPYFGQSVEFLQHREYTTGDDLRHIDWKVWAKQDRFYVKQFEEDTNLRCDAAGRRLAEHAVRLGAAEQVRVRLHDRRLPGVPAAAAAGRGGLRGFRRDHPRQGAAADQTQSFDCDHSGLERLRTGRTKTDLAPILRGVAESYPRRGLMLLVSDLLTDRGSLLQGHQAAPPARARRLVFHVMDDDELDFPFNGPTRFEGLELPENLNCNPRALREGYLEAIGEFLAEVRRGCAQNGVDYALLRTSQPLDAALAAFLNHRLGMHSKN